MTFLSDVPTLTSGHDKFCHNAEDYEDGVEDITQMFEYAAYADLGLWVVIHVCIVVYVIKWVLPSEKRKVEQEMNRAKQAFEERSATVAENVVANNVMTLVGMYVAPNPNPHPHPNPNPNPVN
jgi:hypothetical protein